MSNSIENMFNSNGSNLGVPVSPNSNPLTDPAVNIVGNSKLHNQYSNIGDPNLQNPAYTHKPVAYTVKAFAERFKKGNYVVLVNKHALAIKNGVIVDNADMQFKGYRRVVESAFQIKIA